MSNGSENILDATVLFGLGNEAIYSSLEPERELLLRLSQLRQKKGKTQEVVAKKMGTSKSNISRLEKNVHSPTLSTLLEYVQALGYQFHLVLTEIS